LQLKSLVVRLIGLFALGFFIAFSLLTLIELRIVNERMLSYSRVFSDFVEHQLQHFSEEYFQDVLLYTALTEDIAWLTEEQLSRFKETYPLLIIEASLVEADAKEQFPERYRIEADGEVLRARFLVFDEEARNFVKDKLVEVTLDPQVVLHHLNMHEVVEIVSRDGKPFACGLRANFRGLEEGFWSVGKFFLSAVAGFLAVFLVLFWNYRERLGVERELRKNYEERSRVLRAMNDFFQATLRPGYGLKLDYSEILKKAVEIVPCAQGGSILVRRGNLLVLEAGLGYPLDKLRQISLDISKLRSLPDCAAILQGEPVLLTDLRKLLEYCLEEDVYRSLVQDLRPERVKCSLSVAISVEGELQAILTLFNFEEQGASFAREIEIARLFAGQLSALWSRKVFEERLVLQARELEQKSKILSEMLNFMKVLLDPDREFDYASILSKAVELVPGAQKGSLLLREGEVFVFKAAVGYDLEKLARVSLSEEELSREMTREIKIIRNLDELNRSRLSSEKLKILSESGRKETIKATLSIPLVVEDKIMGFFNLDNLEDPEAFGPEEVEIAQLFAEQVNLILERLQLEEKLREQSECLEYLSCHDPLTDLLNRRAFQEMAQKVLDLAHREGKSVFMLYLDLQGFKEFNDRFGHEAGDAVLKVVAERLQKSLRKNDLLARIGGDEFVAVLYGGSRDSAVEIVKRIIAFLGEPLEWKGNSFRVSANVGIASYPEDGKSLEELIRKADSAMYGAKQKGLPFAFLEDEDSFQ